MNSIVNKSDCIAEINRFYKKYYMFCKSPDPDMVRDVLYSAYSLNDKLRKAKYPNFFDSEEFLSIKAIRNFITHQAEILNESKSLPLITTFPVKADVNITCLIPIKRMESIVSSSNDQTKKALRNEVVFYSKYADIYPCIFNFGVRLFLFIEEQNFEINSVDYLSMKNSIEYEKANGYPHFINGRISLSNDGCVDDFLDSSLITMEERTQQIDNIYEEKDGIFTFIP